MPDEKYESYPDLQNIPLSAVLYKNGEKITLDPADPRVIALVNLFNNSVYTGQCSYTQGYLPAVSLGLCGAICTQLSDVEDETNGLLTYDRRVLKVTPKRMSELADKLYLSFNSLFG